MSHRRNTSLWDTIWYTGTSYSAKFTYLIPVAIFRALRICTTLNYCSGTRCWRQERVTFEKRNTKSSQILILRFWSWTNRPLYRSQSKILLMIRERTSLGGFEHLCSCSWYWRPWSWYCSFIQFTWEPLSIEQANYDLGRDPGVQMVSQVSSPRTI
jgi:hypothetical protein